MPDSTAPVLCLSLPCERSTLPAQPDRFPGAIFAGSACPPASIQTGCSFGKPRAEARLPGEGDLALSGKRQLPHRAFFVSRNTGRANNRTQGSQGRDLTLVSPEVWHRCTDEPNTAHKRASSSYFRKPDRAPVLFVFGPAPPPVYP